jgi:hypothetical protein
MGPTELGFGQRQATVPVADCEPGAELQVDFGRVGLVTDAENGRRRVVQGLIFTGVYSRHMFVWPTSFADRWVVVAATTPGWWRRTNWAKQGTASAPDCVVGKVVPAALHTDRAAGSRFPVRWPV